MDVLVPLPVALPLLAAAVLAAVGRFLPAWVGDLVAGVVSVAVTAIGVVLLTGSETGTVEARSPFAACSP